MITHSPEQAFTLPRLLEKSAALYPQRPALSRLDEEPMTYQELHESVLSLCQWLQEQGIGFGDKVVLLSENCPHWGLAYFAVTSMGAVVVPILTEFHADAVLHIIRHSEAKAAFVSEKLFPKVEGAEFDPAFLLINLDTFTPLFPGMTRDTLREIKSAGLREFRKWKEKAVRLALKTPTAPAESDLAAIIYTSGTTGHSKGVMLTHKCISVNAGAVRSVVQLTENDRLLSILPLAHTFECTLGMVLPISHGAHVVYLDKPPTARVLLPALAKVRPTAMLTVPLVLEKMYKTTVLPKLTGNRLSRFLYTIPLCRRFMHRMAGKKMHALFGGKMWILAIGGAPLAADAEIFLREARFPFAIGYGLTECSPILTGSSPRLTRPYSAGNPLAGISLRLGSVNPVTREGEIEAKGPNIMLGYYKMPEMTKEVFTEDGWLRTGDLGTMDEDGYVYIKGRSKNVILGPSGENIYPEEVESFFFASPYVLEVLVYQQEGRLVARIFLDTAKVDELTAGLSSVETDERRAALLEEIRLFVNSKVSSFARIHKIMEQVDPFEKTPTQKIKRYLYVDQ